MGGVKYRQEFYNDLAIESNITDVEFVKNFYHSLVRLTKQRLKTVGLIELPGLADFQIFEHGSRKYMNISTRNYETLEPYKAIKVKGNFTLRKEIREYYNNK